MHLFPIYTQTHSEAVRHIFFTTFVFNVPFFLAQSDVRNCFCKIALPLRSICNSLTYDPALLHRRLIFVVVLILCTNGLYCNKAHSSPHLPLQTTKDYNNKPWKTPIFRVDVELDNRP